jgi:hypothetical protein
MLSRLAIAIVAIGGLAMVFGQVIWVVGGILLLIIVIAESVESVVRRVEPAASETKWLRVPNTAGQAANHPSPTLQSRTGWGGGVLTRSAGTLRRKPIQGPRADARLESLLDVYAGRLVERIPREMCVDVQEQIEVRVGPYDAPQLTHGLIGVGELQDYVLPIVETMALALYCPFGDFEIEPMSESEQLVIKDVVRGSALYARDYGRWRWRVTPRRTGPSRIALRVTARVLDSHGLPAPHTLVPDKTFRIDVRINKKAIARKAFWWLAVTVPAAAIVTLWNTALKETVWPLVRDLIKSIVGA